MLKLIIDGYLVGGSEVKINNEYVGIVDSVNTSFYTNQDGIVIYDVPQRVIISCKVNKITNNVNNYLTSIINKI